MQGNFDLASTRCLHASLTGCTICASHGAHTIRKTVSTNSLSLSLSLKTGRKGRATELQTPNSRHCTERLLEGMGRKKGGGGALRGASQNFLSVGSELVDVVVIGPSVNGDSLVWIAYTPVHMFRRGLVLLSYVCAYNICAYNIYQGQRVGNTSTSSLQTKPSWLPLCACSTPKTRTESPSKTCD